MSFACKRALKSASHARHFLKHVHCCVLMCVMSPWRQLPGCTRCQREPHWTLTILWIILTKASFPLVNVPLARKRIITAPSCLWWRLRTFRSAAHAAEPRYSVIKQSISTIDCALNRYVDQADLLVSDVSMMLIESQPACPTVTATVAVLTSWLKVQCM